MFKAAKEYVKSTTKILYDEDGNLLCTLKSSYGGARYKMLDYDKNSHMGNYACELLKTVWRPSNSVKENFNRRKNIPLKDYYEFLIQNPVPKELIKYKDEYANLRFVDGNGYIELRKVNIVILLRAERSEEIKDIINYSKIGYKSVKKAANERLDRVTRPFWIFGRAAAGGVSP